MKKKILLGVFTSVIIVFAVCLLGYMSQKHQPSRRPDSLTEQDRKINEKEALGDVMIWESLSRHFMTFN